MAAAPQRPQPTWVLLAVATVGALIVGVAVTRFLGGPGDETARDTGRRTTSTEVHPALPAHANGPTAERAGLEVGFSHDEPGAVAATVAFATAAQRWLYFSDGEIRDAVAEIATPVAAPRMADDVAQDVSMAREQLDASPGRVWWLVRPLAWRVDSFATDQARVAVWVVTILSATEVAAPQADYTTITLDLAWVDGDGNHDGADDRRSDYERDGDWRVDAVRDTPGPTPMTGPHDQPWDALPFDEALDGFTRMDGEPVR
jgi:hypothetical protein